MPAKTKVWLAVSLFAAASVLTACGDDDAASGSGSGGGTADTAAASEIVAGYDGKPSAFPVDQPLESLPAGSTIGYLQCSTPICGLVGMILQDAADTLGVKLETVKAGPSVTDLQNAMDTLMGLDPDAVILVGIEPAQIQNQIKSLEEDGVPIVGQGIMHGTDFGIDAVMSNEDTMEIAGQLLAGYAIKTKGADSNAVIYTTPELSFAPIVADAFQEEYKKLCPDCEVREVDVALATFGNTAPQAVLSDLQANPDTNQAIYTVLDASNGLPAALKTAGLEDKVDIFGYGASPVNLQDIQSGGLDMGITVDSNVNSWTLVDIAARLIEGLPLTEGEKTGLPPMQIIEQKDIADADLSGGLAAYPDFVSTFEELWGKA